MEYQNLYPVLIVPEEEGGYSTSVPGLPGCFSQGETIKSAYFNTCEAIHNWIAAQEQKGEKAPLPAKVTPKDGEEGECRKCQHSYRAVSLFGGRQALWRFFCMLAEERRQEQTIIRAVECDEGSEDSKIRAMLFACEVPEWCPLTKQ